MESIAARDLGEFYKASALIKCHISELRDRQISRKLRRTDTTQVIPAGCTGKAKAAVSRPG